MFNAKPKLKNPIIIKVYQILPETQSSTTGRSALLCLIDKEMVAIKTILISISGRWPMRLSDREGGGPSLSCLVFIRLGGVIHFPCFLTKQLAASLSENKKVRKLCCIFVPKKWHCIFVRQSCCFFMSHRGALHNVQAKACLAIASALFLRSGFIYWFNWIEVDLKFS